MNAIKPYLQQLKNARVLVIGDLILDHYIWGKVDRVSPEAPVPVVRVTKENFMAGGCANVALNIKALNGSVGVCGVIGKDVYGKNLISCLERSGINPEMVIVDEGRPTTLKTRIIAHHQHVVRVDKEEARDVDSAMIRKIKALIQKNISHYNVIILSDYAKGFITRHVIEEVRRGIKGRQVLVLADPKVKNINLYKGFYLVTPNRKEALEAAGVVEVKDEKGLINAGRKIVRELGIRNLLITRGEEGMSLFTGQQHFYIPTFAQQVFDVSGAGDTVIAAVGTGLSAGLDLVKSCIIANIAASVVVAKMGTATATWDEIEKRWNEMDKSVKDELGHYL